MRPGPAFDATETFDTLHGDTLEARGRGGVNGSFVLNAEWPSAAFPMVTDHGCRLESPGGMSRSMAEGASATAATRHSQTGTDIPWQPPLLDAEERHPCR